MNRNSNRKLPFSAFISYALLFWTTAAAVMPLNAAVLNWTGGASSSYWTNGANWNPVAVPASGDTLVFPAGQPSLLNTNPITNLVLNQIRFTGNGGGYELRGNTLTITNSIQATNSTGTNLISNTLSLANDLAILVGANAGLTLNGALSGTGGITKTGFGRLVYGGSGGNSYFGTTVVNAGELDLAKSSGLAIPSNGGGLIIGDGSGSDVVRYFANQQIWSTSTPLTINSSGLLDLNGYYDGSAPLTMNGGQLNAGTNFFAILGMVRVTANSTISGRVRLDSSTVIISNSPTADLNLNAQIFGYAGTYGLTKAGSGSVFATGSNSYGGLTVIQQGAFFANNSWALGTATAGIVVSNLATLSLGEGVGITNEALALWGVGINPSWGALDVESGVCTWAGPITNYSSTTFNVWSFGSELHIAGPVTGVGGVDIFGDSYGSGTVFFEGTATNNYSGVTKIRAPAGLVFNKGSARAIANTSISVAGSLAWLQNNQTDFAVDIDVQHTGSLQLNGHFNYLNSLTGNGSIQLGSGWLGAGFWGGLSTFDGVVFGPGRFYASGTYSPGASSSSLLCSNADFYPYLGTLRVDLLGAAAGVSYDQVTVAGHININGSLQANPAFTSAVFLGEQFVVIRNDGAEAVTGTFNGLPERASLSASGYEFTISYIGGDGNDVVLTLTDYPGAPVTHYVDINNHSPVSPYRTWATAANVVQDALDVSLAGDTVFVRPGIYAVGGRAMPGSAILNRAAIQRALRVESVSGPAQTIIMADSLSLTTRCAYVSAGAVLSGFTLTNGNSGASGFNGECGGGVRAESASALITNCAIFNNWAPCSGGADLGTYINCGISNNYGGVTGGGRGVFINCIITRNSTPEQGGGISGSATNCLIYWNSADFGGGATDAILDHCRIVRNTAVSGGGGGTLNCTNYNCLVSSNLSNAVGGGMSGGVAYNCTIVDNHAYVAGGGAYSAALTNCIIVDNELAQSRPAETNLSNCAVGWSCATPLQAGPGNIANAPIFVDEANANFRLQSGSPCINVGNNSYAAGSTDLDGRQRTVGGTVDMGSYEYQGSGMGEYFYWLERYGLPTDPSIDHADGDGDGADAFTEWRCGTDPTNFLSVLRLLPPTNSGTHKLISWFSVTNRAYFLERATRLTPVPNFTNIGTNISGQSVTTSCIDTNPIVTGPVFYRVGVP